MRIAIATGTRADWGLLQPLAAELRKRNVETEVIATNMHLLPECGLTVKEIEADGFGPEYTVPTNGVAASVTAQALEGFNKILKERRPDAIVILGDRFEMLGAASGALLAGVPIIHIAGGTISEGAFDDSIRHAITKMASLHLVETEECASRVIQMGENPDDVIITGATGVFNAMHIPPMTKEALTDSLGFNIDGEVILATLHAATLDKLQPLDQMKALIAALEEKITERRIKVVFSYPNNDVDSSAMIEEIENLALRYPEYVLAIPSLGRIRYLSLLRYCVAAVGNSSSGLVEVPSIGIPTLDIGARQKGRECGESVIHCGSSREEISAGLDNVLSEETRKLAATAPNPYYKENTPSLMADAILAREWKPFPQKRFYKSAKN